MRRREVLKYVGTGAAVGAAGVSGCVSEGSDEPANGTDDGDQTDGDGSDDGSENGGDGTTVTDTSFSVVSEGDGERDESASFWFEGGMLNVRGIIIGSDLCKTAELESAEHDAERDALVVSVVTVDAEEAPDACAEALKPIEYEVTVEFEGESEQPDVVVTHDGDEVEAEQGEPDNDENENPTSMTGTEFEVTGTECGTETNEVNYIREQAMSEGNVGSKGTVRGTLWGPDGCTTAELGYASYDTENDTLVADVRSASTEDEACAECVTEVSYSLVAEFENGVADDAAVSHDSVRVGGVGEGVESAEFSTERIEAASESPTSPAAEFFEDEGRIVVTGTVRGNDGCAVARLAEAYVEDGSLVVDVETVSNGGETCTQQLVDIAYTATLRFDGEVPNDISVSHKGESTQVRKIVSVGWTHGTHGTPRARTPTTPK